MVTYDLHREMEHADKVSIEILQDILFPILRKHEPYKIERQTRVEIDRVGIDYLIYCKNHKPIRLELKSRKEDYCAKKNLPLDLALETIGDIEHQRPAWTVDNTKKSELVLFLYEDSGRYHLYHYRQLRRCCQKMINVWAEKYRTAVQTSTAEYDGVVLTWHSKCVFVPVNVFESALMRF